MAIPLVLASKSPARLQTLRSAGIEPTVIVSDVDEDAALAAARLENPALSFDDAVLALAQAKSEHVAATQDVAGSLVLGCDSMLEFDGAILGKPADAAEARDRWHAMRGSSGVLHSGHWLVDARADRPGEAKHASIGSTESTTVHFANLSDAEIDAYVSTGEPLHVAGAFTVDGLGGPFITRIEGDYHSVVGLSLPLFRELLGGVGVTIPELWNRS